MNEDVNQSKITESVKRKVFERDEYTCQLCGSSRQRDGAILHVDHIYPRSKGGSNDMSNLQTLCRECNVGKSDLIIEENSGNFAKN